MLILLFTREQSVIDMGPHNKKIAEVIIPTRRKTQFESGSNATNSDNNITNNFVSNKDVSPLLQTEILNNIQQLDITPTEFKELLSITDTKLQQVPQIIVTQEKSNMKQINPEQEALMAWQRQNTIQQLQELLRKESPIIFLIYDVINNTNTNATWPERIVTKPRKMKVIRRWYNQEGVKTAIQQMPQWLEYDSIMLPNCDQGAPWSKCNNR